MAIRDPTRPQLDFPALVAELITQLRLTGQVGLLDFSDQVVPVFLIGSRGIDFGSEAPTFRSASVFAGAATDPAAETVVADTGQLPAGTYDVQSAISFVGSFAIPPSAAISLQHRDAANLATLATLLILPAFNLVVSLATELPQIGYVLAVNERMRITTGGAAFVGGMTGTIFVQIRPTP